MSALQLFLFGVPRLERDQQPVTISRRKGMALLAYMALSGQPQSRESLATLLWPESDQSHALGNLRRELSRLKRDVGEAIFTADRRQVSLAADPALGVDAVRFRALLANVRDHDHFPAEECADCLAWLTEAVALYQDDFMAGFTLPACAAFDRWQFFEAEGLRHALAQGLEQLVGWHASKEAYDVALPLARRWLALDPLREPAQRALMRLYARAGQQARALRQYEECRQLLSEEIGVEPEAETTALYEAIRARRLPQQAAPVPVLREERVPVGGHLPAQPTLFVGREEELAQVRRLLLDEPGARLLTLIGPGGAGKTRLALEVARQVRQRFGDGVQFVSLASLATAEQVVAAIADSFGFHLNEQTPLPEQLFDYLQSKHLLLLVDNCEHLESGARLLAQILQAAPDLVILATSQEALSVRGEIVFPLPGMALPAAVTLLLKRGEQVRAGFTPDEEAEVQAARITRLVEGMPLALVLAAGWLDILSLAEIADELEVGLDLLETEARDVPARQRSVRAAFDYSWQRLQAREQQAFCRLSVFRGGFTRQAAQRVADIGLRTLRVLARKSFISVNPRGRYEVHEVLRQYGQEKLALSRAGEATRDTHSAYYLQALQVRQADLQGRRQRGALDEIESDLENVRIAWRWALQRERVDLLIACQQSLHLFFQLSGRYREAVPLLEAAYTRFAPHAGEPAAPIWRQIVPDLVYDASFVGRATPAMKEDLLSCLEQAEGEEANGAMGNCLLALGAYTMFLEQDNAATIRFLQRGLQCFRDAGDKFSVALTLVWLGFAHGQQGERDLFYRLSQEGLAIARQTGNKVVAAAATNNLVFLALTGGDYDEAETYCRQALSIGTEAGRWQEVAVAQLHRALLYLLRGEVAESLAWAEKGLQVGKRINVALTTRYAYALLCLAASIMGEGARALAMCGQGQQTAAPYFYRSVSQWAAAVALLVAEDYEGAWTSLRRAMTLAHEAHFQALLTWQLPIAAVLLASAGKQEQAVELLALVAGHPQRATGWLEAWPLFQEARQALRQALGTATYEEAWQRGERDTLNKVVTDLCASGALTS